MEVLLNTLSLLTAGWVVLGILAGLFNTLVEYIDEHVLEKLRIENKLENPVGTLVLFSGFFGIIVSAGFTAYTGLQGNLDRLFITSELMWGSMMVGALEVVWMVPYLYAINRAGAINTAPLFQLVPVVALVLGLTVFGEVPSFWQTIGALAITAGGFILSFHRGTMRLDLVTISLMATASAIISAGYFLFKDVANEGDFYATSFWGGIGMFLMSCLVWVGYPPYRHQFRKTMLSIQPSMFAWQTANELLNSLAVIASHIAVIMAPSVMLATALNASHPIFILLIGLLMKMKGSKKHEEALSETTWRRTTSGITMIAVGCVAISF